MPADVSWSIKRGIRSGMGGIARDRCTVRRTARAAEVRLAGDELRKIQTFQLRMNRAQRGKQPLVVGRVGRVAHANHPAIGREQPAPATAFDGLPRDLQVRRSQELVDRRHAAGAGRGIVAVVAADADHRVARSNRKANRRQPGRRDVYARPYAHQAKIALQVVAHELTL